MEGGSERPMRGQDPVSLKTFIMCTRHYFQNLLSTQTTWSPMEQLHIPFPLPLTTHHSPLASMDSSNLRTPWQVGPSICPLVSGFFHL